MNPGYGTRQEDVVNATASAPDWQRRLGPDGQAHTHQEHCTPNPGPAHDGC